MTALVVLVAFMMLSIDMGKRLWQSRTASYTVLVLFAFLQATFVLFEMFRMKPPAN